MRRPCATCLLTALTLFAGACEDSNAPGNGLALTAIAIPPTYGIHDTYVRDGIAFVCAWNDGVRIYDVGNGVRGGTPSLPVLVSRLKSPGWGRAHNAWWFHNPNTSERRYLFVGEEGPSSGIGSSSGDIHVLDVSDLGNPTDVATFRVPGAGTHNFWMDESAQILYAAYYNAGVLALDVSGPLSGTLDAARGVSVQPGGAGNTFTWGVQLATNGWLYAIDMLSGLWQLAPGASPAVQPGGGNNVPERYSSDLWVHGEYAFTGTWGHRSTQYGNAVKIWHLEAGGAPVLVDSIVLPGVGTVSDVEVSPDGNVLMFSAENGSASGVYWYDLNVDPAHPVLLLHDPVDAGVHTATFATIDGRLYAFAARNPSYPALLIYDVTQLLTP